MPAKQARGRSADELRSPRRGDHDGALRSAVARLPEGDVGGAVFGRAVELDDAPAQPVRPRLQRGEEARRFREGQDGW